MRQRKFYHLSRLLGPEEREEFREFLDSPYHNKSRVLIDFWDHWQEKVLGGDEGEQLSIAQFLEGTDLKRSRFDKMCSTIHLKAKEFLALQSFKGRGQLQRTLTAAAILERDPQLSYDQKFLQPIYKEMAQVKASPENYLHWFLALSEYSQALILTRRKDINWEELFKNLLTSLEHFYQSKRLQLTTGAVNSSHVFRVGELPGQFTAEDSIENPITKIYRRVLALQTDEGDTEEFDEILKEVEGLWEEVDDEILFDVYAYMMNYCIREINAGNTMFQGSSFTLYLILLKRGRLFIDGNLPVQHLKNIVSLGTRLGHLEAVREVVETYGDRIPSKDRPLALAYNEAVLQFYEGNYAEVIRELSQMELNSESDMFYGLDARIYLWKAYYEGYESLSHHQVDDMHRHYHAVRLYIRRNERLSELQKTQYSNFVRWFNRLLKIKEDQTGNRQEALAELRHKLQSDKYIHSKSWILDKIDQEIEDARAGK